MGTAATFRDVHSYRERTIHVADKIKEILHYQIHATKYRVVLAVAVVVLYVYLIYYNLTHR